MMMNVLQAKQLIGGREDVGVYFTEPNGVVVVYHNHGSNNFANQDHVLAFATKTNRMIFSGDNLSYFQVKGILNGQA